MPGHARTGFAWQSTARHGEALIVRRQPGHWSDEAISRQAERRSVAGAAFRIGSAAAASTVVDPDLSRRPGLEHDIPLLID